jgi:hypothetical protein
MPSRCKALFTQIAVDVVPFTVTTPSQHWNCIKDWVAKTLSNTNHCLCYLRLTAHQ